MSRIDSWSHTPAMSSLMGRNRWRSEAMNE